MVRPKTVESFELVTDELGVPCVHPDVDEAWDSRQEQWKRKRLLEMCDVIGESVAMTWLFTSRTRWERNLHNVMSKFYAKDGLLVDVCRM